MSQAKATPEQLDRIGQHAAKLVQPGDHVGLGSGKAALAFVRALGKRVRDEKLNVIGVPTSILTEGVAREAGIPLKTLEEVTKLDIAIDGADEVDPYLNLIKGGGGNLTREKVIASISKKFVIVVGHEKIVARLGVTFPVFVEVIEFARPVVTRKLIEMGATVTQRTNVDGSPFLTDNNNPYLMARFGEEPYALSDPAGIEQSIRRLPGVVETGLFVNMATQVIVARADGEMDVLKK